MNRDFTNLIIKFEKEKIKLNTINSKAQIPLQQQQ